MHITCPRLWGHCSWCVVLPFIFHTFLYCIPTFCCFLVHISAILFIGFSFLGSLQ
ncbi:hypothetical protein BCR42DRAFT_412339 [Absidia repens]|uniref:Uncharacterized protein n=1 Tax=Absidia repens TaxID=90262 RepID=A0A1X2IJH6_9FUNG|nr:hypothetical protein BCR42DRAFT_412339 [Absidia repens]